MTFMTYEKFTDIFFSLYQEKLIQDEFYDSLPDPINAVFTDNDFVVSMMTERNMLLKHLFPDDINSDIDYFLYEWKEGAVVTTNEVEYTIDTIDDILDYFKEVYY